MVEIIKGNYGKCYFVDCIEGMKNILTNEHFDMCLTDPPYNVNYETYRENGLNFNDTFNAVEYQLFSRKWYELVMQYCDFLVFTCGNRNLSMWYRIEEPFDKLIWLKRNSQAGGKACKISVHEEILIYGKPKHRYRRSVLDVISKWGFIRDPKLEVLTHTTPKPVELWRILLMDQKPKSVLDCFLGSGTTAEICEEYSINWVGFELNPSFKGDIQYRIERGINRNKDHLKGKKLREM